MVYDRSTSFVYKFDLASIPDSFFDTRLFHISGITLALAALRETAVKVIQRFRQGGAIISLDVNYRVGRKNGISGA